MYLSKYQEYGLRSMIYLASRSSTAAPDMLFAARDISEAENIPQKFLEHVLLVLKKAGLLGSKLGASGGYFLTRSATEISLGQVIRALDGKLEPIPCAGPGSPTLCACPDPLTCGLRMVMKDAYISLAGILDRTSLEDVSRRVNEARSQAIGQPQDI